jgi:molybdate transport system regulatory protein
MAKARAQFHLRVVKGNTRAIGPGKIALLEAIRDTGSISAAARKLRMSYRRAWVLVDDLNRRLSRAVVGAEPRSRRPGTSWSVCTGKSSAKPCGTPRPQRGLCSSCWPSSRAAGSPAASLFVSLYMSGYSE